LPDFFLDSNEGAEGNPASSRISLMLKKVDKGITIPADYQFGEILWEKIENKEMKPLAHGS